MTYFKCRRALPRDGGVTLRQFVESRKEWLEEQFGKMGNIMGVWG